MLPAVRGKKVCNMAGRYGNFGRRQEILSAAYQFIVKYSMKYGYAPSSKELMEELNTSHSTVDRIMQDLRDRNLISTEHLGKQRAYRLTRFKLVPREKKKSQKRKDIIVKSITCVDLARMKAPAVALFYNLPDYPGKYVARIYDQGEYTDICMVWKDIQELNADIWADKRKNWTFYNRGCEDVPELLGAWME